MRRRRQVSALGTLSMAAALGLAVPGSAVVAPAVIPGPLPSAVIGATGESSLSPASDSPVADAAMRGDTETVRSLLRDGADVNAAQGDGMTALHWAALNGDIETMQVLLYAGANLEPLTRLGGYTPLHLASRKGQGAAVEALLEAGSDASTITSTGVTALHLAAESGQPDAVRALLAHGAVVDARDSSGRTPLIFATARDRVRAMEALIEGGVDVSLATNVIDYVELERIDDEQREIRRRVKDAAKPPDPDEPEQEPAARGARPGAPGQQRPARAGAPARGNRPPPDPDDPPRQQPPDPDDPPTTPPAGEPATPAEPEGKPPAAPDPSVPKSLSNTEQIGLQGGMTALHYAARDGHIEAAMLLLEAEADVNELTKGDQSSPLLVAVINGNFDLAMMLLERGADPNLVSEDGVGPLFAAINNEWALRTWYPQPTASQQQETSYLELMEVLLEAGAEPNARTKSHVWYAAYNAGRMGVDFTGATPFWRAAYAADVAAMRLLAEYGADPNIATIKLANSRRRRSFQQPVRPGEPEDEDEPDPSGLPPVPPGGPHVHPLHAASGVGFGTSRVGQQHRHVPDGWLPAVRYLVEELGVDVNVRDADGYTAMHNAAARGDNEMIMFLAAQGADVRVVSRRGQTTVDMANGPQQRVQPFPDTIALLEKLGAVNNHNCISCD